MILNSSQAILYILNVLTVNHDMVQQKYSDRQQVLIKNGSRYVRVYPCRLELINHNNENISRALTQPS